MHYWEREDVPVKGAAAFHPQFHLKITLNKCPPEMENEIWEKPQWSDVSYIREARYGELLKPV